MIITDENKIPPHADLGTRVLLLKVATRLFAKQGIKGTSVREIAKESGQNLSLISYYFGGKEGLYQEILRLNIQDIRQKVILDNQKYSVLTQEIFRQEILRLISAMVNLKINSPDFLLIMQREQLEGMPRAREIHEELIEPVAEKWFQMMEQAQAQGLIKKEVDSRSFFILMMQSIWGYFLIDNCQLKGIRGKFSFPEDKEEFKEFIMNVFLEGIFQ